NEDPFAMIIDLDDIKIHATATQKMRDLFKTDQDVTVKIDDEDYTGEVLALNPLPNENGEYELNVKVENEDKKMKTRESSRINTDKKLEKDAVIVPTEAIVTSEKADFVYIVEDDKAKQSKVDTVESQTKNTSIKGEVSEGDNVIINGQSHLSD